MDDYNGLGFGCKVIVRGWHNEVFTVLSEHEDGFLYLSEIGYVHSSRCIGVPKGYEIYEVFKEYIFEEDADRLLNEDKEKRS